LRIILNSFEKFVLPKFEDRKTITYIPQVEDGSYDILKEWKK